MDMIEIIRGDTCPFSFKRRDKNNDVITEPADKLYFTIKQSYQTDEVLIQKTIDDMSFDDGTYRFVIEPEDTNDMEYGIYVFDIEVITDEYKQTIARGQIRISEEVTFQEDEV